MRKNIHPMYHEVAVTCSCGNKFSVRSTFDQTTLHVEFCHQCHPVYTGKHQVSAHLSGRADRFNRKYKMPTSVENTRQVE